jgi:hypothetical protein
VDNNKNSASTSVQCGSSNHEIAVVVRRMTRNMATSANTNHEIAVWGSLFVARGEENEAEVVPERERRE